MPTASAMPPEQPGPPIAWPTAPPAPVSFAPAAPPPPEDYEPGPEPKPASPEGTFVRLELGGGMTGMGRFPDVPGRNVEEALDGVYGLALRVGTRRLAFGLAAERVGLGKDHFGPNASGETLGATYGADVLWISGRWYTADVRPAAYIELAGGPALPTARVTGTHVTGSAFTFAPTAYDCSAFGRAGGALSLAGGAEFDVGGSWSVFAEGRMQGFFLSRAREAFGTCAPPTGPGVGGALRIGLGYRFGP